MRLVQRKQIHDILAGYKDVKIATLCSHSALQIFAGAKEEGFETIGICIPKKRPIYDSFPHAKPDKYIMVETLADVVKVERELVDENAVLIPHGSFVEYAGKHLAGLRVPIFGNRLALLCESDRKMMLRWMQKSGLRTPKTFKPGEIDRPCIVKFPGAKGGKGYFIVRNEEEFEQKCAYFLREKRITQHDIENVLIQEYMVGVRFYPHYFYSPFSGKGTRAGDGSVELMGVDKRIETNVDEIYRSLSANIFVEPSFAVAGNTPVVVRESLLTDFIRMGKDVAETADDMFGGIPGPFCIETICDEDFVFTCFEISARIVAGTNLYHTGSPYSAYTHGEPMSMGRRIARELRIAHEKGKLDMVIY